MNTVRGNPRRICGLLLLVALVAAVGCGEDSVTSPRIADEQRHEDSAVQNLDLAHVQRVVASTLKGSISLRGQTSTTARLVIRKIVRAATLAEAQRVAESIRVDVRIIDGELRISAIHPEPLPGVNVELDYDLFCPAGVDLDLEAANGTIQINRQ